MAQGKPNGATGGDSEMDTSTRRAPAAVRSLSTTCLTIAGGIDAQDLTSKSFSTRPAQNYDSLSPHSPGQRNRATSESGSNLSFRHVENVPARGTIAHAAWEHSWSRLKPSHDISGRQPAFGRAVDKNTTVKSLRKAMSQAYQTSAPENQDEYLPLDKLGEIINENTVRDLLRNSGIEAERADRMLSGIFAKWDVRPTGEEHRLQNYNPERAATRRRRIFAILVLMDKIEAIEAFIKEGIDDSALPLRINIVRDSDSFPVLHAESNSDAHDDEPEFQHRFAACFAAFSDEELREFRARQQLVHVPFFQFASEDAEIFYYDLDSKCVLPFVEAGHLQLGGYGSVKRVVVHPEHHNYGGIGKGRHERAKVAFAVKKINTPDAKQFKKEVEVFERLAYKRRRESPDHLMHLELAYWHGEHGFLVFPWADGNLKDYWKHCMRDPTDRDDIVWFFKQCFGLALGLRRLHNPESHRIQMGLKPRKEKTVHGGDAEESDEIVYDGQKSEYGRHGDIKPENILWFKSYDGHENHLVISDFGSTEFNSRVSRSHVPPGKVASAGYTGTYQPPEYHFGGEVSRKYDIWSLGCVFLELAVWLFSGKDAALDAFPQERLDDDKANGWTVRQDKFYAVPPNGTPQGICEGAKPSVLKRIESIHKIDNCSAAVHDFLDMIQYRMLVTEPKHRSDGSQIRNELQSIYQHCCSSKGYASYGYSGEPSPFYRTPSARRNLAEKLTDTACTTNDGSPNRHRANSYEIPRLTEQMMQSSNEASNSFTADGQIDDGDIVLNSTLNTPEKGRHRRRLSQLGQPPLDSNLDFRRPMLPRDSTRATKMSSDSHASMMPITQITTPDIFVLGDSAEFPDVIQRSGDRFSDDECSESLSLEESASYRPGSRATNTVSNLGRATPEYSEVGYPSSEGLEGNEIKTPKNDPSTPDPGERPAVVGQSCERQVQPPLRKRSPPGLVEKAIILSEANANAHADEPRRRKRDSIRAKLHDWFKPFQTHS